MDVDDFGMILKSSSIEEIKNSLRIVSNLPAQELKMKARKAWEYARANHTREKFSETYRNVIEELITKYHKK